MLFLPLCKLLYDLHCNIFLTCQRLQEMQSLQDQVEEAEKRHSAVEEQVSLLWKCFVDLNAVNHALCQTQNNEIKASEMLKSYW